MTPPLSAVIEEAEKNIHRYTITSEGASKGYFRLVEDPDGVWVTFAEVEALLAALSAQEQGQLMAGRRNAKQFNAYRQFTESVKRGERAIVMGPDYVVLSKNAYDALVERSMPLPPAPKEDAR